MLNMMPPHAMSTDETLGSDLRKDKRSAFNTSSGDLNTHTREDSVCSFNTSMYSRERERKEGDMKEHFGGIHEQKANTKKHKSGHDAG